MKTIIAIVFLFVMCRPALAQFGGSVVFDPTVDSDVRLDTQVNSVTARALITPPGAGLFQSDAPYLDSLRQNLAHGIDGPQPFASLFPGWLALGPNSTQTAKQVASVTLQTYAGAIGAATQQMDGFSSEDNHLQAISARAAAASSPLMANMALTDAVLALAQQIQLERQLLATLIIVDSVKAGFELNDKARAAAQSAQADNGGIAP